VIPFVATGLTWLRVFKGPCMILALAGVLAGGVAGYRLASAIASGRVARAEKALVSFREEIAQARLDMAARDRQISDLVLEARDEQKNRLGDVADAVRDLGQRVRLCASKSDVRVTVTPAGTIEAVPGGQLRDPAGAVREFAQSCASARDRDAVDHNALIDWLERVRK